MHSATLSIDIQPAQVRQNQRDTMWHTWTVTQGFPVMGIWRPDNDGTDINSACSVSSCVMSALNLKMLQQAGAGGNAQRSQKQTRAQCCTLDPLAGSLEEYVLTAGDDGRVRIFNYPCVVENAPGRKAGMLFYPWSSMSLRTCIQQHLHYF
eukprot:1160808-Pelagomonas_calceolata.AAC.12